ncbi:Asp-tRNA(Asn)/Glu-tRNA(Gln) amidotransferase subunit GatB [Methyloradius palustris]|uniref:Aspartyl/glutamyl-tRNA(Asn/Gln) amidotransferase subunit B n=1 Tax=Methyloradius palustris TaxID=2778876 RepID=A0A8D5GD47_9PROT|nr:Asp-tRNA(Asn)/Glu-tRNA(Gln) amidotransferase subunit GatB [Methyloradius palustris]BCM26101.1 aspartyl/glutamyl-tRNA(Asn/Gln) amidotransferase subunit B [Methyloradius palustris]
MEWEVVIGLETHTQLKTKSKIFSGSSIAFGAEPNTQASAVDIALPGVLPVLNKEAVKCAIKFGLAVNAEIAPRSVFNRKNYFYPDLPKGYQISQFELPVVGKGSLTIQVGDTEKTIRITRAHLEEDAGKSLHGDFEGMTGIDLNRAGTPLLEIVTEPDMRSAAEAVAYAKKLHELVQWIDICDGNMQEGSFRCDVNVSVRKKGSDKLGTRREIKNLNSFKFMQQAIEYETRWQIETLEDGGTIQQATVLFNPDTGETRSMRSKEEANDYRYFPDPDLLPLDITEADKAAAELELPELPEAMKARFESEYQLSSYDAATLTASKSVADYFIAVVAAGVEAKPAANWIMGTLAAKINAEDTTIEDSPITAELLASLLQRIADGSISNNSAKLVFERLWASPDVRIKGVNAHGGLDWSLIVTDVIDAEGLVQVTDSGAIEAIIDEVLAANAAMVEEFKAGKEKAFNALVGQAMKASKGKANPGQVNEILKKKLTA